MLVTALCHVFFFIAKPLIAAFPAADLSALEGVLGHIADLWSMPHALDAYLPVSSFLSALGIYIAVWAVVGVIVAGRKVWSLVAGGGGV
jgi:hypothetical protein